MNDKPLVYWVSTPTEVEYDMHMLRSITKKIDLRIATIGKPGIVHWCDIDMNFVPNLCTTIDTSRETDNAIGGQTEVFNKIVEAHPDLVIKKAGWTAYITNKLSLFPSIMNQNGIKHCLWTSEQGCMRDWQMNVAKYYNWVVVNNTQDLKYYTNVFGQCKKISYMPFGCVPEFHKKMDIDHDSKLCSYSHIHGSDLTCKVESFYRVVQPLFDDYTPEELALYGKPEWYSHLAWKFFRGEFPYKEFPYINSMSDIQLGISANTELGGYGTKLAKMLSCGAFVLWDYTKGIEDDFEYGKHLVWTKSAAETKELVKYYLDNPKEREKIAKEGQKYAHKYLSWETNILNLLKEVG
jgi:hypothetical protein